MGIMAIVLTEQKTEQTAETTSCEQKAMTWWETSKTTPRHRQTTETTQTNTLMSLQLRQHRTTQTTPSSEGNGDLASARRRSGLPQAHRGLWHRVGDACLRLIYVPVGVWPTKVRPADVLSGRFRPHSLKM